MVFISYSHDSIDFCNKVLEFSNYLRSKRIDAIIDQYEESPEEGWPRWMETQIRDAEFVLVVCSFNYHEKLTLKTDKNTGLGVKWETSFILTELHEQGGKNTKFIPIIFSDQDLNSIPAALKGFTRYNVVTPDGKKRLINRLKGIPNVIKPSLPVSDELQVKTPKSDYKVLIAGLIDERLWKNAFWTGVGFDFNDNAPPYFGLSFKNLERSNEIFANWIEILGDTDTYEEIYISIIQDDISKLKKYYVHIGTNINNHVNQRLKALGFEMPEVLFSIEQWQTIDEIKDGILERFKSEYNEKKQFYFLPIRPNAISGELELCRGLKIKKSKIYFKILSTLKQDDFDFPPQLRDNET